MNASKYTKQYLEEVQRAVGHEKQNVADITRKLNNLQFGTSELLQGMAEPREGSKTDEDKVYALLKTALPNDTEAYNALKMIETTDEKLGSSLSANNFQLIRTYWEAFRKANPDKFLSAQNLYDALDVFLPMEYLKRTGKPIDDFFRDVAEQGEKRKENLEYQAGLTREQEEQSAAELAAKEEQRLAAYAAQEEELEKRKDYHALASAGGKKAYEKVLDLFKKAYEKGDEEYKDPAEIEEQKEQYKALLNEAGQYAGIVSQKSYRNVINQILHDLDYTYGAKMGATIVPTAPSSPTAISPVSPGSPAMTESEAFGAIMNIFDAAAEVAGREVKTDEEKRKQRKEYRNLLNEAQSLQSRYVEDEETLAQIDKALEELDYAYGPTMATTSGSPAGLESGSDDDDGDNDTDNNSASDNDNDAGLTEEEIKDLKKVLTDTTAWIALHATDASEDEIRDAYNNAVVAFMDRREEIPEEEKKDFNGILNELIRGAEAALPNVVFPKKNMAFSPPSTPSSPEQELSRDEIFRLINRIKSQEQGGVPRSLTPDVIRNLSYTYNKTDTNKEQRTYIRLLYAIVWILNDERRINPQGITALINTTMNGSKKTPGENFKSAFHTYMRNECDIKQKEANRILKSITDAVIKGEIPREEPNIPSESKTSGEGLDFGDMDSFRGQKLLGTGFPTDKRVYGDVNGKVARGYYAISSKYALNPDHLDKGRLYIRYISSKRSHPTLSNIPITRKFGKVIKKAFVDRVALLKQDFNSLNKQEKLLFKDIVNQIGIPYRIVKAIWDELPTGGNLAQYEEGDNLVNRYHVLQGELMAGSYSDELIHELKTIVRKLEIYGYLTSYKARLINHELDLF